MVCRKKQQGQGQQGFTIFTFCPWIINSNEEKLPVKPFNREENGRNLKSYRRGIPLPRTYRHAFDVQDRFTTENHSIYQEKVLHRIKYKK